MVSTVVSKEALPAPAYIGILLEDIEMAEGMRLYSRRLLIQPDGYEGENITLPSTLLGPYRYRRGLIYDRPSRSRSFRVSAFHYESAPPHPILYPYFLKRLKGTFPRTTLRSGHRNITVHL